MNAVIENNNSTTNTKLEHSTQFSLATHIRAGIPSSHQVHAKSLLNPLLSAAYPLFNQASRLQLFPPQLDPFEMQQSLCSAMEAFEKQCSHHNLRNEQILLGRYFLCALLDDIIEHQLTPPVYWVPYSLLTLYYQESLFDNRLFTLIDRLKEQPPLNLFLLEMAYMILVYGYQGFYRQEPQGNSFILTKLDELYHVIRWQHGDFRKNLFIPL